MITLRDDPAVAVIILTGAGEKAFVAGTDIEELKGLNTTSGAEFSRDGQAVFDLIETLGKPVIAAVNGYALGGGCELAMACTLRIASDRAKFGQPEINLGVIPGYGGTQRLPRLVGKGKALEMILTGTPVGAEEALRLGLVNSVVPAADLLPAAERLARTMSSKSRPAVRLALSAVQSSSELPLKEGQQKEAELFGATFGTEDAREGIAAFIEKRPPVFHSS
jgi:enoyl-CoA hydratase